MAHSHPHVSPPPGVPHFVPAKRHVAETGQVLILELPLDSVRPCALNDQIYRPVSSDDPDVIELAESIRKIGLQEPIVITADDVILSGHRRYAACRLLGHPTIRCRREPIRSTDPDFPVRLCEFNRQRVKSLDEQVREEVVRVDPEDAHRRLREHRAERARVTVRATPVDGRARRAKISSAKEPFLRAISRIIEEQKAFWPLSDRRIHYALLNDPPLVHASKPDSRYQNHLKCYKSLCDLLTRARLQGQIPMEAIHDPTRPTKTPSVYSNPQRFVKDELKWFLQGYFRDLQRSQPNHLEIVGEKNTIEPTIRPIAERYCIPVTIARGYCSLPPRVDIAERFRRSGKERLILLVLCDHDPEGEDIGKSFARSLRDDLEVTNVDYHKVALTREQVQRLGLLPQMKAKKGSSRYDRFAAEHGDDVYELEAVAPEELQRLLDETIRSLMDLDTYDREVATEKHDAAYLDTIRRKAVRLLGGL